jgi:hypothetical protein
MLLLSLLLLLVQASPLRWGGRDASPSSAQANSDKLETMIGDMSLPHEARPSGVPDSYDWSRGPRLGRGNDPGTFVRLIAWGHLYEAVGSNPASNTRVQLKDIETWLLSRATGEWTLLQASEVVAGAAFREDYSDNANVPADIRLEAEGGVSVTAGGGYNFHFWPTSGRAPIDPVDVAGVVTRVRARLILDDPNRPDDRSSARYILGMGADYWRKEDSQYSADFRDVADLGIGRFRFVTREWQSFYMHTLSPEQLQDNPPPLGHP